MNEKRSNGYCTGRRIETVGQTRNWFTAAVMDYDTNEIIPDVYSADENTGKLVITRRDENGKPVINAGHIEQDVKYRRIRIVR